MDLLKQAFEHWDYIVEHWKGFLIAIGPLAIVALGSIDWVHRRVIRNLNQDVASQKLRADSHLADLQDLRQRLADPAASLGSIRQELNIVVEQLAALPKHTVGRRGDPFPKNAKDGDIHYEVD